MQPETPLRGEVTSKRVTSKRVHHIQAGMRRVQRRQWWLWSTAVMATLLLTVGIASFAFPELLAREYESTSFNFNQALRGLVGLVLVFSVYTVYQQLQIHRMQRDLTDQILSLEEMEARTEEVYKLAPLDPLTELHNRRAGERHLVQEMSRAKRHGCPLTVLLLDVNKLKAVNEGLGHAAGDELIKYVAERLKKASRGSDLGVRLGGDEFLLIFPDCRLEEVTQVIGRLKGMKLELEGQVIEITFSVGWTAYVPGESYEELMNRADAALYSNKRAGGAEAELRIAGG